MVCITTTQLHRLIRGSESAQALNNFMCKMYFHKILFHEYQPICINAAMKYPNNYREHSMYWDTSLQRTTAGVSNGISATHPGHIPVSDRSGNLQTQHICINLNRHLLCSVYKHRAAIGEYCLNLKCTMTSGCVTQHCLSQSMAQWWRQWSEESMCRHAWHAWHACMSMHHHPVINHV